MATPRIGLSDAGVAASARVYCGVRPHGRTRFFRQQESRHETGGGKFRATAVVATVADQRLGSGEVIRRGLPGIRSLSKKESGAVEEDVGDQQPHRTTLGDVPRLVEVRTTRGEFQPRSACSGTG